MADDAQPTNADFNQAAFVVLEDDSSIGKILRRNRLTHTLGNLTLVTQSFNSGVSNLGFDVKQKEFEDQSILMLTKDFVKKKKWDEDDIVERSKALFDHARTLWIAP